MQLFKTKLKHWVFTILEQSTVLTFFKVIVTIVQSVSLPDQIRY